MLNFNRKQVPQRAVLFCSGTLYIGVVLSYFLGDRLFNYLAGSLSYTVLLVWFLISLAGFLLALKKRVWSAKSMSLGAMLALVLIFIGILLTNPIGVTLFTGALYLIILFSYRRSKPADEL